MALLRREIAEEREDTGALLELRDVAKEFLTRRHQTKAIDTFSMAVQKGEFVYIVGPSGCGKSTLLNIVAGLERPSAGRALFDDRPILRPRAERGVVFQEPALYPWLNVRANVELGLKIAGRNGADKKRLTERYIELVNLVRKS